MDNYCIGFTTRLSDSHKIWDRDAGMGDHIIFPIGSDANLSNPTDLAQIGLGKFKGRKGKTKEEEKEKCATKIGFYNDRENQGQ